MESDEVDVLSFSVLRDLSGDKTIEVVLQAERKKTSLREMTQQVISRCGAWPRE